MKASIIVIVLSSLTALIDRELDLLASRKKRDLISRLKPVEPDN